MITYKNRVYKIMKGDERENYFTAIPVRVTTWTSAPSYTIRAVFCLSHRHILYML
jgi:hypothetical protein